MDLYVLGKGNQRPAVILASTEGLRLGGSVCTFYLPWWRERGVGGKFLSCPNKAFRSP